MSERDTVAPQPQAPSFSGSAKALVIRDFVNTLDAEEGTDELSTKTGLTAFLHSVGLLERHTRSSATDLALARELRTGLHEALSLTHARDVRRLPELDAVASQLPLQLRWLEGEPRLAPVDAGVLGALAKVLIAVETAAQSGTWERLKICSADTCAWAYYDASKNQSRNWCEYGCGNKIKTRAYRARRQASAAQSPSTQSRTSGMSSRCSTT